VALPRAGREPDGIPGAEAVEPAVEPDVRRALDDIDELLLGALGMRIGATAAGQEPFVMDADPGKAEVPAECSPDAEKLVIPLIVRVIRALDIAPVGNAVESVRFGHRVPPGCFLRGS
jgi:hypothetical protein